MIRMPVARDTKQRILAVGEHQFAGLGIESGSLRGIIGGAEVKLAAVHYHFRSKEGLLEAALLRRNGPLNQARLLLLENMEKVSGKKGPDLEDILFAFLEPPMQLLLSSNEGRQFGKLLGRL